MAKKHSRRSVHDWDRHVARQQKRERLLRNVLISVLGVVLLGTLYLGAVIALNREEPPETPGEVAGGPSPGEDPAMPEGAEEGESAGEEPAEEPMEGQEPAPGTGEPGAEEVAGTGEPPAEDTPPPVSPLFANDLVDNNLDYIDLGEEGNLLLLLAHYAEELEEESEKTRLKTIFNLLREKKTDEALAEVDKLKAAARIKEGTRAVVLTRLLKKEEAGRAYLEADRYAQPSEFHFEYGFYHLGARDLPQAYTQFSTGVRKNPRIPALRFVAAGTAFDMRKWQEVIEHVDAGAQLVEKVPPKIGLMAALAEARIGKRQEAVDRCRKLLEDDPEAAEVKLFLARALGAMGQLDESLEIYRELNEAKPDVTLVKVEMTRAYLANDEKEKALEVAEELAGEKPDDVRIQAWYADILAANGKIEEASGILEGLSEELKANEMAVLRSLMAIRQEDYQGAGEALEPYHTMDANLALRWAGLKFRIGETGQAVRDVLNAHQLNAAQWKAVADVAVRWERWDAAAYAYEKAIAAGDQSVVTLNNWAWTAMQNPKGFDADKIIDACKRALTVAPGQPNILETYGQALLKSDQAGRCMELLVKNSEITEKSAELSLLQGRCYIALKAKPSAIDALERCLKLMEGVPRWYLEMSREEIEQLLEELKG